MVVSMSLAEAKFGEWASRIEAILEKDGDVSGLKDCCRFLLYWSEKLENGDNGYEVSERTKSLVLKSVDAINLENGRKLGEVEKHRRGTKIRLKILTGWVYVYVAYVHHHLYRLDERDRAKEILGCFTSYVDEVGENVEKIDSVSAGNMVEFMDAAEELGVSVNSGLRDVFEAKLKEGIILDFRGYPYLMWRAKKRYEQRDYLSSLVLSEEAMLTVLEEYSRSRWILTRAGDKPGEDWDFYRYCDLLRDLKELSPDLAEFLKEKHSLNCGSYQSGDRRLKKIARKSLEALEFLIVTLKPEPEAYFDWDE